MAWELEEAIAHYRRQGAPGDQNALIALLREIQRERGGVSQETVTAVAAGLGARESLVLALIRRIPSLRLAESHTLEVCAWPNCGKAAELAKTAQALCRGKNITLKFTPCMRQCGKGPNIRWDGTLHHQADGALLKRLME